MSCLVTFRLHSILLAAFAHLLPHKCTFGRLRPPNELCGPRSCRCCGALSTALGVACSSTAVFKGDYGLNRPPPEEMLRKKCRIAYKRMKDVATTCVLRAVNAP